MYDVHGSLIFINDNRDLFAQTRGHLLTLTLLEYYIKTLKT